MCASLALETVMTIITTMGWVNIVFLHHSKLKHSSKLALVVSAVSVLATAVENTFLTPRTLAPPITRGKHRPFESALQP